MSNTLNVCLYNAEPSSSVELTKQIASLNFVRLIGEATGPIELANALAGPGLDIIFFHLDPEPGEVIEIIDQVSTRHSNIALIAISHKTSPEAILAPMRAGCEQYVCEPIESADLAAAVSRVTARRAQSRKKSNVIAVVGSSGGAGTTTIASNLALEIGHLTDHQCALIDLDLQFGDAAMNFDLDPKYSIYDLADTTGGIDASVLDSTMSVMQCKVSLLARPERMEQADAITPDVVYRVIEVIGSQHECVVLDMPRIVNPVTMAAFAHTDRVLIVAQALVPSIRNAHRLYESLASHGIPKERLEVVLNRFDSSSGRVTAKDVEELIKPVFASIPNDYQFVAKSLDFGRPVAAMDRTNSIRKAIRTMAKKLVTETVSASETTQPAAKRGLFNRLLR